MSIDAIVVVSVAVLAGIILFGVVVGLGSLAVRWLGLPTDPPEAVIYEPPAQAIVPPGDRAAAQARAAQLAAVAALGRRARAVLTLARSSNDLAEWIASCDRDRSPVARSAAAAAISAADRAREAFIAGDQTALAAAELEATTAAERVRSQTDGLPDWRTAERRKLLLLSAALVAALSLAVVATWLR